MKKIFLLIIVSLLLIGCKQQPKPTGWLTDHSKTKVSLIAGKKHGVQTMYSYDGRIAEETTYKNGIKDGPYYDHMLLNSTWSQKGTYLNGKKDGIQITTSDEYTTTSYYKNDQLHGTYREVYTSGDLKGSVYVRNYKNGLQEGPSKSTSPYGTVDSMYKNDEIIWLKGYDTSGKLTKHEKFRNGKRYYTWPNYDSQIYSKPKTHKKASPAKSKTVSLNCSNFGGESLSLSERSREEAIARSQGQGVAITYSAGSGKSVKDFCVYNANVSALSCSSKWLYLDACMSKLDR